jgi:hypothetical protein
LSETGRCNWWRILLRVGRWGESIVFMAVWKEYAEGCVLREVTVVHRGLEKRTLL